MSWMLLSLLTAQAVEVERPEGADVMHRALSQRETSLNCAELASMSPTPVAAMVYIAERVPQPPWAGVRAAQCLSRHHAAEARPQLLRWVSQEETRGLAMAVWSNLEAMPVELSVEIAQVSLAGPLTEMARPRIQNVEVQQVRALAE